MAEIKKFTLGSGYVYISEFTGVVPDKETLAVEENLLGYISNGAVIEYKPTFYVVEDDMGKIKENVLTVEEASFKTGVLTFNAETLDKIVPTGSVTSTATMRTIDIGGKANDNGKKYVFMFEHLDSINGNTRVWMVGKNQSGFTLNFVKDKETIIDVEIKASPLNDAGTLIRYEEDIPAVV